MEDNIRTIRCEANDVWGVFKDALLDYIISDSEPTFDFVETDDACIDLYIDINASEIICNFKEYTSQYNETFDYEDYIERLKYKNSTERQHFIETASEFHNDIMMVNGYIEDKSGDYVYGQ